MKTLRSLFEDRIKYVKVMHFMIFLLFLFQIIDVIATQYAMQYGIEEKNPIAKNIIDNYDNPFLLFTIIKILMIIIMAITFQWWLKMNVFERKYHKEVIFGVTFIVTLIYSTVLFFHTWNFILIQILY